MHKQIDEKSTSENLFKSARKTKEGKEKPDSFVKGFEQVVTR